MRTVVLFFEKGQETKRVWYYRLNPGRNLGKTNPLNDADLEQFVTLQKSNTEGPNSWILDVTSVDQETWDLAVRNPNAEAPTELASPKVILAEIRELEDQRKVLLAELEQLLS